MGMEKPCKYCLPTTGMTWRTFFIWKPLWRRGRYPN